ncbi:MAG: MmcQ/YjbR family DNA-binding protein, partial [Balneolaceae bacterium]
EFPFDENTLVFKVMGKMFALANVETFEGITLKCDPVKANRLRSLYPEVEPGYHMNKKHWNTVNPKGKLEDELIKEWIRQSYELVTAGLPKKERKKLKKK